MVWFKVVATLLAMYIAQSYYFVSDANITKFLEEHNQLSINNPTLACDNYSDDLIVNINHRSPKGKTNVTGGKKQLCNHIAKQETILDPSGTGSAEKITNIKVDSSFPWQMATVSFDKIAARDIDNLGTIHSETHEVVVIKRELLGIKMAVVTSEGGVKF